MHSKVIKRNKKLVTRSKKDLIMPNVLPVNEFLLSLKKVKFTLIRFISKDKHVLNP